MLTNPNPSWDDSRSITAESSREWIRNHELELKEYLLLNHQEEDWRQVAELMYWHFPDEGKKLIENFQLSEQEKKNMFMDYIISVPQLTWLTFADERMGKDALICEIIQNVLDKLKKDKLISPRVVTLMNVKCPPFVKDDDMYFSFKDIPSGKMVYNPLKIRKELQEVWVYSSELELILPARELLAPENKLFSAISGTFAQNHIKLVGAVKLASKVDINAIRSCNAKSLKYINPEKLEIANVERNNILSPLGYWLLPRNKTDKSQTLLAFDNNLFSVHYGLPVWWNDEYSEQFKGDTIPESKIWDYIDSVCSDMKPTAIRDIIAQKFRNKTISIDDIQKHLDLISGT